MSHVPFRTLTCFGCLLFLWSQLAWADIRLGERTEFEFTSAAEAQAELSTRDAFVARMSPFDRSARLKTDKEVDEATYLAFVGQQTLEWSAEERQQVTTALEAIKEDLLALHVKFPEQIRLIKTTGLEEGGAAYTRGNAIVLPRSMLGGPQPRLQSLLCHELFHVLSRHDARLRERLYRSIGFKPCAELELPEALRRRRITNPDGPIDDHCIKIKPTVSEAKGQEQWAIPILTATADRYDTSKGGEFFNYLTFKLILVHRDDDNSSGPSDDRATRPVLVDGQPVLVAPQEAGGFMEQIGRNTGYIIHPDEVLADNFVIIVQGRDRVPSPDVLTRIRAALPGDQ